ncbi:MAG: DUF3828 domain-containing protein [Brevundimonas sp.]|uniref:DUF3828 domain-containing protein n=1 Tax=Brevundimonas sp. TaxID=1871086 RepID=UPI0027359F76|nr:DUF3828 domain-containing protein [Brevundimonas sp.]MDP3404502.1 DUF3828 domain-containing protein [Brevundimonas sp.]
MMRTVILFAASALALAACSPEAANDAQGDTPAAATATASEASLPEPGTREAIYAAAAVGPEPFVRAIYDQFTNGGPRGEPLAPGQDPIFSRIMNALIGADFRAANGEVPTLNYNPFCTCQDQGEFVVTALAVAQADANAADASVAFTNAGQAKRMELKLVREGGNWKVDDIVDVDGQGSLHDALMKVAEAAG